MLAARSEFKLMFVALAGSLLGLTEVYQDKFANLIG